MAESWPIRPHPTLPNGRGSHALELAAAAYLRFGQISQFIERRGKGAVGAGAEGHEAGDFGQVVFEGGAAAS